MLFFVYKSYTLWLRNLLTYLLTYLHAITQVVTYSCDPFPRRDLQLVGPCGGDRLMSLLRVIGEAQKIHARNPKINGCNHKIYSRNPP